MIDADEVVDAYRHGAALHALAQQHGVAPATIRRVILAAGEPIRPAGRRRLPVSSDDIAELRDAGVSWDDISTRLGITPKAARTRYDEVRSQRGLVRWGLWQQVLTEALDREPSVAVLPTLTAYLGRWPTSHEARSARRAAQDLVRRGLAVAGYESAVRQGRRAKLLVLRRQQAQPDSSNQTDVR